MALGLDDYQMQFDTADDSLLFGPPSTPGTVPNVDIVSISGLFDLDVRIGDREFAREHGDIPGLHRAAPRDIRLELEIRSSALNQAYYDLIDQCRDIFTVRRTFGATDGLLTFKMPGEVEQIIRCRPTRRRLQRDARTEYGLLPFEVELRASDPRIYAVDTDTSTTNNGNGFAYPVVNFGAVASASITNATTGDTLSITGATGSGNLIADMDKWIRGESGLLVYRGSTDNYGHWDQPRSPFRLAPGANSISGSSYSLVKRHTWI